MTMSKYTTQVRWIVEQTLDDLRLDRDEKNWGNVYKKLGLDDYPIFEEAHRKVLNDKIIRRYYFREIGFETAGQFRMMMRRTMHEIMPYYNQLYLSEGLITDPLQTKNLTYKEIWSRDEKTNRAGVSDSTTTQQTTNDDRNVYQDTPMNGLDTGAIEAMDYATNVTFDHGTTDFGSSSTNENSSDYTGDFDGTKVHEQKGFDHDQSELLLTYRKTFLNIDLEIVESLNDLFMGLW